ncbi:MAG: hypothetical protein GXP25_24455 [Planctomycetes bacterium]|nr:hypothetical protein [Planctomycetota bacterium]
MLTVADGKGDLSRDEVRKPKSRVIEFNLDTRKLSPGSYTLTAELREDATVRGKASATFDITP